MLTLPSGIKKYQATDNATVDNFNVNADLLDAKITELNAHEAATTAIHGSTSAATANRIIQRDSAGRAKVAAPAAADDIARKDTVDAVQTNLTAHVGTGGTAHATATTTTAGFISSADQTKLNGVATGANNYVHPSGDGNQHVPATGTTNNGKFLKAGSTAGSAAWGNVAFSELTSKPTTLSGYGITDSIQTRLNSGNLEYWNGGAWISVGAVKSIQRGIMTPSTSGTVNVTISAVNMAKASVNMPNFVEHASSSVTVCVVQGYLTSSTNLAFDCSSQTPLVNSIRWEVIEYY